MYLAVPGNSASYWMNMQEESHEDQPGGFHGDFGSNLMNYW